MKRRIRALLLLILDVAMVWMEWRALWDTWWSSGTEMFRFYTNDSNILGMLVCGVCAVCGAYCLIADRPTPRWTLRLRHMAASCLMVTLIVAACILVPMGKNNTLQSFMLEGNMLYLHTLCPLIMLASVALQGGGGLTAKHALTAVIPTAIYGAVSIVMNLRRVYEGPYPFLRVLRQPVYATVLWCLLIVGGNFVIAWLAGMLAGREQKA